MSKVYVGTHKEWRITRTASSPELVANAIGCGVDDLQIEEIEKEVALLRNVPPEFRGTLSYMAYERGHSAGQDEIELILEGLVNDLATPILNYGIRIQNEAHNRVD